MTAETFAGLAVAAVAAWILGFWAGAADARRKIRERVWRRIIRANEPPMDVIVTSGELTAEEYVRIRRDWEMLHTGVSPHPRPRSKSGEGSGPTTNNRELTTEN